MPGAPAPAGPLQTEDGLAQIPVAAGGSISSIIDRINKVPIEQIAQNALQTTHNLSMLTSSPKLKDAVVQLDAARAVRSLADYIDRHPEALIRGRGGASP